MSRPSLSQLTIHNLSINTIMFMHSAITYSSYNYFIYTNLISLNACITCIGSAFIYPQKYHLFNNTHTQCIRPSSSSIATNTIFIHLFSRGNGSAIIISNYNKYKFHKFTPNNSSMVRPTQTISPHPKINLSTHIKSTCN
jgi:hypothetical protein